VNSSITQSGGAALATLNYSNSNLIDITGGQLSFFNGANNGAINNTADNPVNGLNISSIVSSTQTIDVTVSRGGNNYVWLRNKVTGGDGLNKYGPGTLILGSSTYAVANNYTGFTTIYDGTLRLIKPAGVNAIYWGDVIVNGGVLSAENAEQIYDGTTVILNGGTANFYASETIGRLLVQGGGYSMSAPLTLTSTADYAFSATAFYSIYGTYNLTGASGGGIAFNTNSAGTTWVDSAFNLGGVTREINDGGGTVYIWGSISNGGINKTGSGSLVVNSAQTYSGGTAISAGTLQIGSGGMSGSITGDVSNGGTLAFNRYDNTTFGGVISGGAGQVAKLGSNTLTLTGNNTYGGVTTISEGTLQIGNSGATGTLGSGSVTNNGALVFSRAGTTAVPNNISGSGSVSSTVGEPTLSGVLTYSGATTVSGGRLILATNLTTSSSLSVVAQGSVKLASNGTSSRVIKTAAVSVSGQGNIDLADNKMIVTGMPIGSWNGSAYTDLIGLIQKGRGNGSWNGTAGVVTSMPDAIAGLTGLGVATATQLGRTGQTFGGITLAAGDVLVMYTYGGDANLDGFVSGDDYSGIDFNILVPGSSGWANGDFNYDGAVTGDDYSAIDFSILAQGAPFPSTTPAAANGVSVLTVPEPVGFAVAATALVWSLARRSRAGRKRTAKG
jgi:autotransporter-associated beta strand protein